MKLSCKTTYFLPFLLMMLMVQCREIPDRHTGAMPISHDIWGELLKEHVNEIGMVNYEGFAKDSVKLQQYISLLSSHYPNEENWSRAAQLAYWINAYNAFTVKIVLQHYPLESIKDIGSGISIPFVNSVWDIKFIKIEGEKYDLNNIEHGILRKKFDEPRIHFAINCASFSCPLLRQEAYLAEKIDQQLEEQAILFINDPARNKIGKELVQVSKIFSWFSGDFTKHSTLIDYLNQFSKVQVNQNAKVNYMDYNWSLNDVKSN